MHIQPPQSCQRSMSGAERVATSLPIASLGACTPRRPAAVLMGTAAGGEQKVTSGLPLPTTAENALPSRGVEVEVEDGSGVPRPSSTVSCPLGLHRTTPAAASRSALAAAIDSSCCSSRDSSARVTARRSSAAARAAAATDAAFARPLALSAQCAACLRQARCILPAARARRWRRWDARSPVGALEPPRERARASPTSALAAGEAHAARRLPSMEGARPLSSPSRRARTALRSAPSTLRLSRVSASVEPSNRTEWREACRARLLPPRAARRRASPSTAAGARPARAGAASSRRRDVSRPASSLTLRSGSSTSTKNALTGIGRSTEDMRASRASIWRRRACNFAFEVIL